MIEYVHILRSANINKICIVTSTMLLLHIWIYVQLILYQSLSASELNFNSQDEEGTINSLKQDLKLVFRRWGQVNLKGTDKQWI